MTTMAPTPGTVTGGVDTTPTCKVPRSSLLDLLGIPATVERVPPA